MALGRDESGAKALFDKYRDAEREEATITFDGIEGESRGRIGRGAH